MNLVQLCNSISKILCECGALQSSFNGFFLYNLSLKFYCDFSYLQKYEIVFYPGLGFFFKVRRHS